MYYAHKYEIIAEVCNKKNHKATLFTFDLRPVPFYWENTNKLLNNYFIGGKTGNTPSAGPCLVCYFKFGQYESQGCLIDSKNADSRWKEMSTILLWQFDKYLQKNKIGAYSSSMVNEF